MHSRLVVECDGELFEVQGITVDRSFLVPYIKFPSEPPEARDLECDLTFLARPQYACIRLPHGREVERMVQVFPDDTGGRIIKCSTPVPGSSDMHAEPDDPYVDESRLT